MPETAALVEMAKTAAREKGIPETLFLGLIRQESAWNPSARSGAGALGLTQVMPWWAPKFGITEKQLLDPKTNLSVGAEILRQELVRFGGSWALAAMAYNAGAGAVSRAITLAGSKDPQKVSDRLRAAETRAYWKKVLNWAESYAGRAKAAEVVITNAVEEVTETAKSIPLSALLILMVVGVVVYGVKRG